MIKFRMISTVMLSIVVVFMFTANSPGMTDEEMKRSIESYIAAEKSGDYAEMAMLLGVGEGELKQALKGYVEGLSNYFASRMNLRLKEIRFGGHQIIFTRPGKKEAFVGQEIHVYLENSGKLRRQHEYSLFRVTFDEHNRMRWQLMGSSRGDFEDIGQGS